MLTFANLFNFNLFNIAVESVAGLLYPSLCMHCDEFLTEKHTIFCESCFSELQLFPLDETRCCNCFQPIDGQHSTCQTCQSAIFTSILAAFPLAGASATLHSKLKSLYGSYLCKAASAFMAMQMIQANWPLPDLIVPLPQSLNEKFFQSHNYNASIAKELAHLLNRPFVNPFRFNRKKLDFSEIKPHVIENKNLLLVADLLSHKGKIHECAEILAQGYPKNLYGIALCQTI